MKAQRSSFWGIKEIVTKWPLLECLDILEKLKPEESFRKVLTFDLLI